MKIRYLEPTEIDTIEAGDPARLLAPVPSYVCMTPIGCIISTDDVAEDCGMGRPNAHEALSREANAGRLQPLGRFEGADRGRHYWRRADPNPDRPTREE